MLLCGMSLSSLWQLYVADFYHIHPCVIPLSVIPLSVPRSRVTPCIYAKWKDSTAYASWSAERRPAAATPTQTLPEMSELAALVGSGETGAVGFVVVVAVPLGPDVGTMVTDEAVVMRVAVVLPL